MTCFRVNCTFTFAIKYKLRRAKRVEKWQLSAFFIYAGPQIAISIVCVCITTGSTACLEPGYLLSVSFSHAY